MVTNSRTGALPPDAALCHTQNNIKWKPCDECRSVGLSALTKEGDYVEKWIFVVKNKWPLGNVLIDVNKGKYAVIQKIWNEWIF